MLAYYDATQMMLLLGRKKLLPLFLCVVNLFDSQSILSLDCQSLRHETLFGLCTLFLAPVVSVS